MTKIMFTSKNCGACEYAMANLKRRGITSKILKEKGIKKISTSTPKGEKLANEFNIREVPIIYNTKTKKTMHPDELKR